MDELSTDATVRLKQALKEQYHGGLVMLAECVQKCPDDLWLQGKYPRRFRRIAFHAAFYALFYLGQDENALNATADGWPAAARVALGMTGAGMAVGVEPYDLPEDTMPLTRQEMLEYIAFVRTVVDPIIDGLDLDRADTGFPWYPNMTKLSHELMNLRHIQGHTGQLSELLMAQGIDTGWAAKRASGQDLYTGPH